MNLLTTPKFISYTVSVSSSNVLIKVNQWKEDILYTYFIVFLVWIW